MSFLNKLLGKKEKEVEFAPILPKEIYEAGVLELRDVIAPAALKVAPKEVVLGEKIARSFFVVSYPRNLTDNWLSPIVNLDKVFDVSIFVHPVDTASILKK